MTFLLNLMALAEGTVVFEDPGIPPVINDPETMQAILAAAENILGKGHGIITEFPSMGSDDFSVFLEYSRGVQFFVGSANNDPATKIGLHCGDNVFDESALSVGVSVFKPFVMGRKNWLFANTAGGAQASAVIYSLMETAKENSLDPYRYLL